MDQWESIYVELELLLSGLPFAKASGSPTYLILEDYGSSQHKIECQAAEYFDTAVLSAIQAIVRKHASEWEVILAGGPKLGPQQAISIYPNSIVPRWSTAQWYDNDA